MAIRRDDNKYTRLSLQQYDGQARNGEIVIDLDTYTVWVGDASGALLPVSGGGNLANAIIGNLTVTGTSNLGDVANITILGGTPGAVLSTDGNGVLTWSPAIPTTYGDANVETLLSGGTLTSNIITTGNVSGGFILGDGGFLSNISSGGTPGGANTQVQFNDGGVFGGNSNFTFDSANASNGLSVVGSAFTANPGAHILQVQGLGVTLGSVADGGINIAGPITTIDSPATNITSANVTLGPVANVHITGGAAGEVLTTDGAGNLSWSAGGTSGAVVPAIYFTATANGNNQTFSNAYIAAYTSNLDITLFYNGALLDSDFYTLSGDTITITTPINTGDSIDIIRTAIANANAISGYSNVQANAFLAAGLVGDILPDGDAVYSLGGPINQWKDLWVSNSTIYFNTVPLSANATTLTFAGDPILTSNSVSNISTTGDITAGNITANTGYFFIGDGGLLSNISGGSYSNADVANYMPTYTGNLDSVAAITASGNITANAGAFFIGDGGLLANVGGTGNAAGANTQIQFNDANAFNGSANFTFTNTGPGIVTIGGEMVLTGNGTIATIGSNLLLQPAGNAIIEVAGRQWTYDLSGSLTVPADSVIKSASGNLTLGDVSTITVGSNINLGTTGTITVNTGVGGLINVGTGSGGNVTIGGTAMAGGNVIVGANTLLANGNITSVGNITAQAGAFFIGDGGLLSNVTAAYGNTEVAAYLGSGQVTDVIPSGNSVYSLGNLTNQWKDIWVSNATIYFNSVPLSANNNTLTFAGEPILVSGGDTNITTTGVVETGGLVSDGNITANAGYFFLGDGGLLSNVASSYGNAEVSTYLSSGTDTTGIVTTGNVTANRIAATTFSGDGGLITNITGGYVVGDVANAAYSVLAGSAATVYDNAQPNITSVGTLVNLTSAGNIEVTAGAFFIGDGSLLTNLPVQPGTYSNSNVASYMPTYTGNLGNVTNITLSGTISGNGVGLSDIAGANVTGQVANALVAGTVYTNAQPNITSVGTLTSLDVTGNITLGAGGFFIGDGGLLSNISGGSNYGNGDVAVYLPTYTGNLGNVDSITTTGNITVGTGSFIIGDGTYLTNVPGAVAESPFSIETASFSAVAGARYGVDTTGGAVTATLPATPATGQAIFFADAGGAYATNNLTVARNGQTIMGDASDLTVNTTNQNFGLFWNGTTWRTY